MIVHSACHHDADPRLHCSHCGEPLRTGEIEVRPGPGFIAREQLAGRLSASRPRFARRAVH